MIKETLLSRFARKFQKQVIKIETRFHWLYRDLTCWNIPEPTVLSCLICTHRSATSNFKVYTSRCQFKGGTLKRYQCPNCDVIFGSLYMLQMPKQILADEYVRHYKIYVEGDETQAELDAFYALNPTREKVYLNYGSGNSSKALRILKERGFNVVGFEPYSPGPSLEEGVRVLRSFEEVNSLKFDGLFSNNLIEHLSDPIENIREMTKLLKDKNSFMAHSTGCYDYDYEYTRFHLFFLCGRSPQFLAERAGLVLEAVANPKIRVFKLKT